jgi:hypothetical protein
MSLRTPERGTLEPNWTCVSDSSRARAKALVVGTAGDRSRSEHQLASMLGVDRMTIRRWRGKQ